MKTLCKHFVVALILLISGFSCNKNPTQNNPWLEQGSIAFLLKDQEGLVQYGYLKNGKIGYIAFTTFPKGKKVKGIVQMSENFSYIQMPNGKKEKLPSQKKLFEYINGVYCESKTNITKSVFEAFLSSNPKEYSIKGIIEFKKNTKNY